MASSSIILAEPEDDVRGDIRQYLEAHGHLIMEVSSTEEALEAVGSQSADLVILDVDLPDGRDWELLSTLKRQTSEVVLIASLDDEDSMSEAMRIGVHEYIPKPIRPLALVATVQAALTAHRLREALDTERRMRADITGVDALTGMHARSRMEELLAFTAANAARYGNPLSIVLFDVDRFDRINNVHGADAAKRVLVEIADHLAADLRSSDAAGRWEDHAFIVLLPHTDLRGATIFAERLRMTFAELPVILPNGTPAAISASFGCATGTDVQQLLDIAVAMLLNSKRSGRNIVSA